MKLKTKLRNFIRTISLITLFIGIGLSFMKLSNTLEYTTICVCLCVGSSVVWGAL